MVLPSQPQSIAEQPALEKASAPSDPRMMQTASLDSLPVAATAEAPARSAPRAVAKPSAAPTRPLAASRPGYILDDAQIASIKARLHLTPDQESMWPAVEAALRNMAYKRVAAGSCARCCAKRASSGGRSRSRARAEIGSGAADHELQCRTKRRSAQSRPCDGPRSARRAILKNREMVWSMQQVLLQAPHQSADAIPPPPDFAAARTIMAAADRQHILRQSEPSQRSKSIHPLPLGW